MDKDQVNADIASKLLNLKKSYVGEYNAEILSDLSNAIPSKIITANSNQTSTTSFNLANKPKTSGLIIDKEKENDIRKLTISNCKDLNSALKLMISPIVREEQENLESILHIRFKVKHGFDVIDRQEIDNLGIKFSQKSLVVFLESSDNTKFFIFWKSKQINYFLTLKPYSENTSKNDKKIFKFVADFLATSLKTGHIGIHKNYLNKLEMKNFELFFLADSRDHNLLLLAAEIGEAEIVESLLTTGMDTALPQQNINAQTLAWNGRHSNVLLVLARANLTYPESIEIDQCSQELKMFYKQCIELQNAVVANDDEKVVEILDDNPTIQYFYNSKNESVAKIALANKCNKSYQLLLDRKIFLAPHENFENITEDFEHDDRRTLREIHFEHKKDLPEKHLNILRLNSFVSHDVENVQDKLDLVMKAYKFLNQNVFLRIILLIVAASKNFKIIYDFNRDSVNVADPTVSSNTQGLFYLSGRIYIGAKQLLSKATEAEAYATLAHEFCHFAMHLVYGNDANPYKSTDQQSKDEFEKISKKCQEKSGKEDVVDIVYELYPAEMFHAELIVRVPHMLALYHDQPAKIQETKETFPELYEHYEKKVMPEMTKAIPEIETRDAREVRAKNMKIMSLKRKYYLTVAFSILLLVTSMSALVYMALKHKYADQMFKFDDLEMNKKEIVRNSIVIYRNHQVLLRDLFPEDHKFYSDLTKQHVDQFLDGKIFNLTDSTFSKVDKTIFTKWDDMPAVLKQIFLNSTFSLQEMDIKFDKFYSSNPEIFKSLSNQQINDVLDQKLLKIGKEVKNETKFFVERKFMLESESNLDAVTDDIRDFLDDIFIRVDDVEEEYEDDVSSEYDSDYRFKRSVGDENVSIQKNWMQIVSLGTQSLPSLGPESISSSRKDSYLHHEVPAVRNEQQMSLYAGQKSQSFSLTSNNPKKKLEAFNDKNLYPEAEILFKISSNKLSKAQPLHRAVRSTQKINSLNSQELVNLTLAKKVFVLHSEPGEGKTTVLQNLAVEVKQKFPDKWVCYVDLKAHIKSYNESGNFTDFWKLMNETVNLKNENEFGKKVFLESYKLGKVVFIWDGIDEVSKFKGFLMNVFKFIRTYSQNVQFIGTNPLHKDELIDNLNDCIGTAWMYILSDKLGFEELSDGCKNEANFVPISFCLIPYNEAEQEEFLRKSLILKGAESKSLNELIGNAKKLMNKLKTRAKFDTSNREFNTPLLLGIFTKAPNLLESGNLYEIYENFLGENRKVYQKQALKAELSTTNSTIFLKLQKFEIFKIFDQNLVDFSDGILLNKGNKIHEFSHKSFSEFLVAQYLIDSIYDSDLHEDSEAELRLELFFYVVKSHGFFHNGILDFMNDYYKTNRKSNSSGSQIKFSFIFDKLKRDFKKFFINLLNNENPEIFNFLLNFFDRNCKVLKELIQFNEDETFYTSIFNPIYGGIHVNPWDIKFDNKCFKIDDNFKNGNDQKGILMMGNFIKKNFKNLQNQQFGDSLNLKAFNEITFWKIANITLKFLNNNEKLQFCKVFLNPKIYLNFEFENLTNYEDLWTVCEELYLNEEDLLVLIGNSIPSLLEADSEKFLSAQMEFIKFYIKKLKLLLSLEIDELIVNATNVPSELESTNNFTDFSQELKIPKIRTKKTNLNSKETIFKIYSDNFILHKATRSYSLFKPLWEFFLIHCKEHQKSILELKDNGEFFHFYDPKTANINQYYDKTKMNILQRGLLATGNDKNLQLDLIQEIYSNYFANFTICEFIKNDSEFISYILQYSDEDSCKKIANYFFKLFADKDELEGLLVLVKRRVFVDMSEKAMKNWQIFKDKVNSYQGSGNGGGRYSGSSSLNLKSLILLG